MLSIHVWLVTAYWTLQFRTLRQTRLFALILKLFPEHPLCQVTSQFSPRKMHHRTFPSSQKALFESATQVSGMALPGKIHFRVIPAYKWRPECPLQSGPPRTAEWHLDAFIRPGQCGPSYVFIPNVYFVFLSPTTTTPVYALVEASGLRGNDNLHSYKQK